jgi:malonyl-CoA O-methyltransferase
VGGERYAVRHTPHHIEDWRRACAAVGLRIVRVLEPLLDRKDIRGPVRFDLTAVKLPVVTVFELSSASRGGR